MNTSRHSRRPGVRLRVLAAAGSAAFALAGVQGGVAHADALTTPAMTPPLAANANPAQESHHG